MLYFNAGLVRGLPEGRANGKDGKQVDLVVLVVGGAEPEADRLDSHVIDTPLATARPLSLIKGDMVLVLGSLDPRNGVRAVERGVGHPNKPILEHVRAAERIAAAVVAGVGLYTARNSVVITSTGERVGVDHEVARSGL